MIGERLAPAFPPIIERRPNPYGPGLIMRKTVDLRRITEEMADPAAVIAEQAKDSTLPIEPLENRQQGYL